MSTDNSQPAPEGHTTFKVNVPIGYGPPRHQIQSLQHILEVATTQTGSGARVCASILGSCYNGNRIKVDLTDLRLLDSELLEHVLNVLKLDFLCVQEVHTYFEDGGAIWERMIKDWDLEK